MPITIADTWMTPIIAYLEQETLPDGRNEARKIMRQAARYTMVDGVLYRRGYSLPLLRCITPDQSKNLLAEVHEGFVEIMLGGRVYLKRS